MKKIRIGICGAGNIATSAHLPSYQKIEEAEIVAICDITIERAKAAAEKFNIPNYYGSVEEMLEKCELDAVTSVRGTTVTRPVQLPPQRQVRQSAVKSLWPQVLMPQRE